MCTTPATLLTSVRRSYRKIQNLDHDPLFME